MSIERQRLERLRESTDLADVPRVAEEFLSRTTSFILLAPPAIPRTAAEFAVASPLSPLDLNRELVWAATRLSRFTDLCNTSAAELQSFSRALLTRDTDLARAAVDNLTTAVGSTALTSRLRVLSTFALQGAEAAQTLVRTLKSTWPLPGATLFFSHGVLDPLLSQSSIKASQESMLRRIETSVGDTPWGAVVRHHFTPTLPPDPRIERVLACHFLSPAADLYEAFISALVSLASRPSQISLPQATVRSLAALGRRVTDSRLRIPLSLLGVRVPLPPPPTQESLEAYTALLAGDFPRCLTLAEAALDSAPDDIDAAWMMSRVAQAGSTDRTLPSLLLTCVAATDSKADAVEELRRLAYCFPMLPWAAALEPIAQDQTSHDATRRSHSNLMLAALGPHIHPLRLTMLPDTWQRRTLQRLVLLNGSRLRGRPAETLEEQPALTGLEQQLIDAESHYLAGFAHEAIRASEALRMSDATYYRDRGHRLLLNALVDVDDVARAQDAAFTHLASAGTPPSFFPIHRLAAMSVNCAAGPARLMRSSILLGMCTDMGCTRCGARHHLITEDALLAFKARRPSELAAKAEDVSSSDLISFLRRSCVESCLERTTLFESSREILQERIAVCQWLFEHDAANASNYQLELTTLLRRQRVKARTQGIDATRVYIDVESLRRAVLTKHTTTFQKCRELISQGATLGDRDEVSRALDDGNIAALARLTLPEGRLSTLLREIVDDVTREFVASPQHGLDKYLSVRIRHGVLESTLRRPVEERRLLTSVDERSGIYRRDEYWPEHLGLSDRTATLVSERLAAFSAAFDTQLGRIKNWIRATLDAGGTPSIHVSVPELGYRILGEDLAGAESLDSFIDSCLLILFAQLEAALDSLRNSVIERGRPETLDLLSTLLEDVRALSMPADVGPLAVAVAEARTALVPAFDRVLGWLRRADTLETTPFTIEESIEHAVEVVRHTFDTRFSPTVDGDALQAMVHGPLMPALYLDVLLLVFANVAQHSPGATVSIRATRLSESLIQLRTENSLPPEGLLPHQRERIREVQTLLDAPEDTARITQEGKTGLVKLAHLLRADFRLRSSRVRCALDDTKGTFVAEFDLPLGNTSCAP
jgi:hypothetical protein